MRRRLAFLAIVGTLLGCVHSGAGDLGPAPAPYAAVQKPVPRGQNRIYLLAAIPGRIVIANGCVLFENLGGAIVLPVFESGTRAGMDRKGAYIFDPVSMAYLRDGDRVAAGGGGSGETVRELTLRNVLEHRVPDRCIAGLSADAAVILNPGLEPARR